MPDGELTFDDLVRGEITFQTEHVPDFAVARANGQPLYTLVNPVDDAMMDITHVLRGEDLLSSTPRQLALYDALAELGVAEAHAAVRPPALRDGRGQQEAVQARPRRATCSTTARPGFLPEGLLNYLALLGWAISGDRDIFSIEEMVEAFEIGDVNPNPARFDMKKAEAINAAHMRLLSIDEIDRRVGARSSQQAGPRRRPVDAPTAQLLDAAMPLVAERINKLTEAVDMLGFLLRRRGATSPRTDEIDDAGRDVVKAAYDALAALPDWTTAAIEEALRGALVEGWGSSRATPSGRCASRSPGAGPPAAVRVAGAARPRASRSARLGGHGMTRRVETEPSAAPTGLPYHLIREAAVPAGGGPLVGSSLMFGRLSSSVPLRAAAAVRALLRWPRRRRSPTA